MERPTNELLLKRLAYNVEHRDRCERQRALRAAEMYQIEIEKLCVELVARDKAGEISAAEYAEANRILS